MELSTKKCKIIPNKFRAVPDLNKRRISKETTLNLNPKQIVRSMNYGKTYEVSNDGDVLLNMSNYNKIETIEPSPKPDIPDEDVP